MKNNYPVKYSVVGIYDEINRNTNEPEYITYIASKCYVTEENIIYNENGTKKKTYGVCFPFGLSNASFSFVRKISDENVDAVYDSFEDALKVAKSKNDEFILDKIAFLAFDEHFETNCEKITKKANMYIEKYKKLEKLIEENTDDMIVGLEPKEQSVVYVTDKVEKVVDLSLYKILELCNDCNLVVYSLSDNEYMALKEDINEDLSLKEYNNKCLMQYNPNIKLFKINNYDDKENPSSFILDENLRPKREISDEIIQEYFNNKPDAIIYTTETYEDVISSYITEKHNFYDNDNEKTPINKKVLFKFKK